jgi:hypothetical protein
MYQGVEVTLHTLVTLTLREGAFNTHLIEDWVALRVSLNKEAKRKISNHAGTKSKSSSPEPVLLLTELF